MNEDSIIWFLLPGVFILMIAMIATGISNWNDNRLINKKCNDCGNTFQIQNKWKKSEATNYSYCDNCAGQFWTY